MENVRMFKEFWKIERNILCLSHFSYFIIAIINYEKKWNLDIFIYIYIL